MQEANLAEETTHYSEIRISRQALKRLDYQAMQTCEHEDALSNDLMDDFYLPAVMLLDRIYRDETAEQGEDGWEEKACNLQ